MSYCLRPTNKKRVWNICKILDDGTIDETNIVREMNLVASSLTNKFETVAKFIDDMNITFTDFGTWFSNLFDEYIDSELNSELLFEKKHEFMEYAERYVKSKNVNFGSFINMKKTTVTSIVFNEEDLYNIAVSSACLKLYGVFYSDGGKIEKVRGFKEVQIKGLRPPENQHKELFRYFTDNCVKAGTTNKIFQLMKSRTFKSYLMNKYLWDLCKIKTSETPDSFIMSNFNFLMLQLFSLLDPDVNPIPYLNKFVDDSIGWLMKSAHDNKVIYGEAFSGTEDIYGGPHNQHSIFVYTCNDVLAKSTGIGMRILNDDYKLSKFETELIDERIDKVDLIYPYMKLLNLPIISNVLEIPYKHLLTIPPKHALLTSVFMYSLAKKTGLDKEYPYLLELLISCPKFKDYKLSRSVKLLGPDEENGIDNDGSVVYSSTKSSYRLRNLEYVLNNNSLLFGFNCRFLRYRVISSICGVISSSKRNLNSILTGGSVSKIKNCVMEQEVTDFYNLLYSGGLKPKFESMRNIADLEYF